MAFIMIFENLQIMGNATQVVVVRHIEISVHNCVETCSNLPVLYFLTRKGCGSTKLFQCDLVAALFQHKFLHQL